MSPPVMSPDTVDALKLTVGTPLLSASLWAVYYLCIQRGLKIEEECASRVVAATHAITVTVLASYVSYIGPNAYYSDPGGPNTYYQDRTIAICLGYFVYDLIWCLYYQPEGKVIIIHHILTIISFGAVLVKGCSGTEALAGIISLEITNPFLQSRWFLRYKGYKHTWLFKLIDLTFILTFFLCRIVWGTYFTYKICSHPRPSGVVKAFTIMLYVLSWGFTLHIMHYVWIKYIKATPIQQAVDSSANAITNPNHVF